MYFAQGQDFKLTTELSEKVQHSRDQATKNSLNYFQRLTLESWYTNLEQTPLNSCQQLPPPYKRLIHDRNETDKRTSNRPT